MRSRDRTELIALVAVVAVAAILRLAWRAATASNEIPWDGAEYARAGANLHAGLGYLGLRGGPLYIYPPLEPIAIAIAMFVTPSSESAGVLVALVAGTLLPVPVYVAARERYGTSSSLLAAATAAALPYAVHIGTIVLADALFVTLAATGLAFGIRASSRRTAVDAIGCGASFGLAYLTRPEGLVLGVAILAAIGVAAVAAARSARALAPAALGLLAFAILMLPEVEFLSAHSGHLRLTGKDAVNLDIGERMAQGMSYVVAADAIDGDLRAIGPEIAPNYYFDPDPAQRPPHRSSLGLIAANALHHIIDAVRRLLARQFGGIAVLGCALVGFGLGARRRSAADLPIVAYVAATFVAYGAVTQFWPRYTDTLIPPLAVCAGAGLEQIRRALAARRPALPVGAPAIAAALVLVLGLTLGVTGNTFDDVSPDDNERLAGTWLAAHASPRDVVLDVSDQATYYADATWQMLPWAVDAETMVRYLHKANPDYIVLDRADALERPFEQEWLRDGIRDTNAQPVFTIGDPAAPATVVYRWMSGHPDRARR